MRRHEINRLVEERMDFNTKRKSGHAVEMQQLLNLQHVVRKRISWEEGSSKYGKRNGERVRVTVLPLPHTYFDMPGQQVQSNVWVKKRSHFEYALHK